MRLADLIPPRVSAAVGGLLAALPDAVGRRLRPAHYRGMPAELPPIAPMPAGERRVLIGVMNTAGQAHRWAAALRAVPGVSAVNVSAVEAGFAFATDAAIPAVVQRASRDWQHEHLRVRGLSATDVVVESGLPIFGPAVRHSLQREVRALQRAGIRVAVLCHGSDVRDVEALNARNPHSPYLVEPLASAVPAMQRRTRERRRVIRATGVPVLGSTQGVLLDLPEGTWVPVVVDPDAWAVDRPPFSGAALPLVVHAPSQAAIKGSDVVDRVVGQLVEEGRVRYERLTGVTHDQVREAYRRADIMIDSLRIGGYGAAACEAMAAGRVVVSNAAASYREHLRATEGVELPIVQADPDSLDTVLRSVLDDPEAAAQIAATGPAYVRALHDGRVSAQRILAALDSPAALGARQ